MPTVEELTHALHGYGEILRQAWPKRRHDHNNALSAEFLSSDPGQALRAMEKVTRDLGLSIWPSLSAPDLFLAMLCRLLADLCEG